MIKRFAIGSVAALCLCGGSLAHAEVEPGTYFGASFGQAKISVDELGFNEGDSGFKAFLGYTFNPYAAIELAYVDGGAPIVETPAGSTEVSSTGVVASTIVSIPFLNAFAGFAKIGLSFSDSEITTRLGTQSDTAADSDVNFAYGIGARYSFLERYEVRIEYDTIAVEGGDFSMMSIGGVYRF